MLLAIMSERKEIEQEDVRIEDTKRSRWQAQRFKSAVK